tara:strand:- start:249 stop:608 length:360 start_codon:yes stop_codon:yes gene_type:complete
VINPPGFAFENYDAVGQWRAYDNGQAVDASGSLALGGSEQLEFSDGVDLARQLANSDRIRDCYVRQWTRYALGAELEATPPGLESLQAKFREDDSIKELLISIASSDLFRARTGAGDNE